jgi:signal transduction histidine kinase/CheY-like chemotaxis protein
VKRGIVFKVLAILGVVITILFLTAGYLFVKSDKDLIEKIRKHNFESTMKALDERQDAELKLNKAQIYKSIKMVAKNSSIYLLNYDIEGVKKSLTFDINLDYIEAIEIWDTTMDEMFLVAVKRNSEIIFSTKKDKSLERLEKISKNIYIYDDGKKMEIGKATIYYGEEHIYERIERLKEDTKAKLDRFNSQIDKDLYESKTMKFMIIIWLLITIFILITLLLVRFVNVPLKNLKIGLDSFFLFLQNKTRTTSKIEINSNDEFGQMASSLNENIEVSTKLHNQIKELNINLEQKIKKRTMELENQKQKAEESTELKSRFLANMSHEIRTPLSAIVGMTYLMGQSKLDKEQKDFISKISSASKNLLNIINDILDFSKIEAGKLEIDYVDFDMKSVISNIKNIIDIKADEKNLRFKIVFDDSYGSIFYGDSLRITQVLLNLCNNAIKFTGNGLVEVNIQRTKKGKVLFSVKDTGIGLTKVQQDKLFISFSQADGSTTRKYGGSGLGLAISKQLVELMGGKIWVDSKVGIGSIFSFEIDLKEGNSENIKQIDKNKTLIELQSEIRSLDGANILLVEDNNINREIINKLLEPSKINIDEAYDGLMAIEMFNSNKDKYDLILMDIQMPKLDGIETTKLIREIDKDIPIIALTANAMKQDFKESKDAGMNEHLSKPIETNRLFETLTKYIKPKEDRKTNNTIYDMNYFDVKKALVYLGDDEELYKKLLVSFYNDYKDIDIDTLSDNMHTLSGLCGNIGAFELKEAIDIVSEYKNTKNLENLLDEFRVVLDEIEKFII